METDSEGRRGQDAGGRLVFRKVDCCDASALRSVFEEFGGFDAVVHFAGLKAVGESKLIPLDYYEVNIGATWTLLRLMEEYGCRSIVFSSSATVYGVAKDEKAKLKETDEVCLPLVEILLLLLLLPRLRGLPVPSTPFRSRACLRLLL